VQVHAPNHEVHEENMQERQIHTAYSLPLLQGGPALIMLSASFAAALFQLLTPTV
jgi:hypothetical protein